MEAALERQPFIEHVQELRNRLFWVALTLLAGASLGYALRQPLQDLLLRPLNQPLFYTSPTGGFNFVLKICLFFGIIIAVPVAVYHLLRFVEPVIPGRTRGLIIKLLFASCFLMLSGVAFAYYVSLPAALHFLGSFSSPQVKSLISTNEYLTFVTVYLAGFAVLFQLPLLLLFINRIKPLKPKKLMSYQRYVILGSFIVAAILTPTPDPLNQTVMAVPIIVLYQLSILLVWLINRSKTRSERKNKNNVQQSSFIPSREGVFGEKAPAEGTQSQKRLNNPNLLDLRSK